MLNEYKSYLVKKFILHFTLLFTSSLINIVPVFFIFISMWIKHYDIKILNLLVRESVDMLVMLPLSSVCTNFFIIKTSIIYKKGLIKSRLLYFIKLFLIYYIYLTIFIGIKILIIIENNIYSKLASLTKFLLYYGTNYFIAFIFIIIFYLKNKKCLNIQDMFTD